jgi:opacity protein-like surface antigen
MIKNSFFLACLLGLSSFVFGQEENKSKFGYGINFGVGNSTLENNQLGNLSGNILALKFNIDYSISKEDNTKIISGIEFIDFNSSFFNGVNQSKLKNEYLQIPLKLTHRISLNENDKLSLVTGIGTYTNFLLRSNITSLSNKINTKSGGVNFGYNILLGMEYSLSQNSTLILNSDIMNEISAIKRNGYEQKQSEILLLSIGFVTKF